MSDDRPRWQTLARRYLPHAVVSLIAVAVTIATLYLSWTLAGPVSTIVYAVLFVVGAGLLPGLIAVMGRSTPFGTAIGKLQFVLGQFVARHGWLVQLEDRWVLCPGRRDAYWFDGAWRPIEDGQQHASMLGWRPFGILFDPEHADLSAERVDPRNDVETPGVVPDGGADVERAGLTESSPNPEVMGNRTWLVDLKALYRSGLARAGNMDLVETAEQQAMRDEVDGGVADTWAAIIAGFGGLIMGAGIGYVVMLA